MYAIICVYDPQVVHMLCYTIILLILVISVSLAVPPTVENAEVSVAVSADSRRAIATYSTGGIYSILGNSTLVFDCNSGWTPALPQVTGIKCMNTALQCLSSWPLVHLYNVMSAHVTNILTNYTPLTVSGWFIPSLVIPTAVLTLILVVVITIIMKRILGMICDFACRCAKQKKLLCIKWHLREMHG